MPLKGPRAVTEQHPENLVDVADHALGNDAALLLVRRPLEARGRPRVWIEPEQRSRLPLVPLLSYPLRLLPTTFLGTLCLPLLALGGFFSLSGLLVIDPAFQAEARGLLTKPGHLAV